MSNYDDLLREKEENDDLFNDSAMEQDWTLLEQKFDDNTNQPQSKYNKLLRSIMAVAAVLLLVFFSYTFLKDNGLPSDGTMGIGRPKSAIIPPLKGADVPYEVFNFDAAAGDTIFTLNGSVIVFPQNALLNGKGEIVRGNIEVRSREFNDAFDYSIAGIPMDYDSAGVKYQFISSGMIEISAYQNGELLKVNPAAKPQLNLVSTNKERNTNLYKLDTGSGKWIYKGKDEVNRLDAMQREVVPAPGTAVDTKEVTAVYSDSPRDYTEGEKNIKPLAPQQASSSNPIINVVIDPASFKELLVYDGMKFEIIDNSETVGADAKTEWNNIELKKGTMNGTYKIKFSAGNKTVEYNVKPVLEGKDFEAAEKLYQEKLKEYTKIEIERKKKDQEEMRSLAQKNPGSKIVAVKDSASLNELNEENKRIEELNKLIVMRNKFIEAENIKIEALNKENRRRRDSAVEAGKEAAEALRQQQATWEQNNRIAALEQNLIRSFEIDGFGYWNCDQPTLPGLIQYASTFKTNRNETIAYTTLCIATGAVNRIQNYYATQTIGLLPNSSCFGWAFNADQFYYFTKKDFEKAAITTNPNTVMISMNLYQGNARNYRELKGFIFKVNNNTGSGDLQYP